MPVEIPVLAGITMLDPAPAAILVLIDAMQHQQEKWMLEVAEATVPGVEEGFFKILLY